MIKYDEYELLEMFESEPILFETEEAGLFYYSYEGKNNIKIVLHVSIYEEICKLYLYSCNNSLFKVTLLNVEFIRQENNSLRIHQRNIKKDYLLHFKPSICIVIEDPIN